MGLFVWIISFVDGIKLFRATEMYPRFSAAVIVHDTSLTTAVVAVETIWISQFQMPEYMHGNEAFDQGVFQKYLLENDILLLPMPARRYHKNIVERKHGIIRNIFIRLKSIAPDTASEIHAFPAVQVSNNFYGLDVAIASELSKGFAKLFINEQVQNMLSDDVIKAREELIVKRKWTRILRSIAVNAPSVHVGEIV